MICICNKLKDEKINTWEQYEQLQALFDEYEKNGELVTIPIEKPYYIGKSANGSVYEWYADRWYKCTDCGTIWEFVYPEFPAQGFVKRLIAEG